MSRIHKPTMLTMKKCEELLQGRCYLRRKMGSNTYLERKTLSFELWLYDTPIMSIEKERWVLKNGGYRTPTTKARLVEYSPIEIYQKDFTWYYYFKGESPWTDPTVEKKWTNPVVIHSLDYFEHMLKTLPKD